MPLQDKHINLAGFLEGGGWLQWQTVDLKTALSSEEWRSIERFQVRAREFLLNVEDLNLSGLRSLEIDRAETKASARSNTYPGRHRAKSLYLDFRHFIANKEPAKFQRVINILKKHLDKAHPIQTFLDQIKDDFLRDGDFGITVHGRNLPMRELIDLWFNTDFFHAGQQEQIKEREEWLRSLQDEAAHHLLAWGVVNAAQEVKSLYACVKDLDRNGAFTVNCPDPKIIFRNDTHI